MTDDQRQPTDEELADILKDAWCDAVWLRKTPHQDGPGLAGSWLGGRPTMPEHIHWPWYHSRKFGIDYPMTFVAQISLSELQACHRFPDYPETGTLFIFEDLTLGLTD